MQVMRASWTFRLVAAILLALCASGAFALCHGDCHSDNDYSCSDQCCHVCRCATVHVNSIEFSPTTVGVATERAACLTQVAVTDIFRPPNTLS